MRLTYAGLGKKGVERRLTEEYALEEATRRYDSVEWKAIVKNLTDEAFQEAGRRDPKTQKALDEVARELKGREVEETLNRRIAELDRKLEKPAYAPGSAGFSLLVDDAREVTRLEQERGGVDEEEVMRRHPAGVATLKEYARYRQHDRGLGR